MISFFVLCKNKTLLIWKIADSGIAVATNLNKKFYIFIYLNIANMNDRFTIEKTAEKYGMFTAIGLIALFFIMKLLGIVHVIELRALNFFVLATGVVMALKYFSKTKPESFTYLKGLGLGVLTGIIGSVLFGLFVFIYTNFLDPAFMQSIVENEPFGRYLNPYIVGVAVSIEGIASALILAFIVMNYMDTKEAM